ncbi:MAG: hypothetical protein F6K10_04610 [Moorea sp. SIO2B7]|nr:hypothetical protein [Moorena sp. SIO2B7]
MIFISNAHPTIVVVWLGFQSHHFTLPPNLAQLSYPPWVSTDALINPIVYIYNPLVIIPYEYNGNLFTPITIHATTRQQIRFRLKSGRYIINE